MFLQSHKDLAITPRRIVSLVPSQTELLHHLGLEIATIGITKFCVHPPHWQNTKNIIGGTKNINVEKIKLLKPDLIIANKEENVKEQIEELAKYFNVWVTDVQNLQSALKMIADIGELTKANLAAADLVQKIKQAFENIHPTKKIKAAYLIWRKPYITIGNDTFIHDMLAHCGLQNIFAHQTRYPTITIEQLKNIECQLLLLSSEPFPFKQKHLKELQHELPTTKIILVDGEMFSWHGSRLLYAAAYFNGLMA